VLDGIEMFGDVEVISDVEILSGAEVLIGGSALNVVGAVNAVAELGIGKLLTLGDNEGVSNGVDVLSMVELANVEEGPEVGIVVELVDMVDGASSGELIGVELVDMVDGASSGELFGPGSEEVAFLKTIARGISYPRGRFSSKEVENHPIPAEPIPCMGPPLTCAQSLTGGAGR
jgi:hypothetical protein